MEPNVGAFNSGSAIRYAFFILRKYLTFRKTEYQAIFLVAGKNIFVDGFIFATFTMFVESHMEKATTT